MPKSNFATQKRDCICMFSYYPGESRMSSWLKKSLVRTHNDYQSLDTEILLNSFPIRIIK